MEIISYNFYQDYIELNDNFTLKLNQWIRDIKRKYQIDISNEELIKEYFVELFYWSFLSYDTLQHI